MCFESSIDSLNIYSSHFIFERFFKISGIQIIHGGEGNFTNAQTK